MIFYCRFIQCHFHSERADFPRKPSSTFYLCETFFIRRCNALCMIDENYTLYLTTHNVVHKSALTKCFLSEVHDMFF